MYLCSGALLEQVLTMEPPKAIINPLLEKWPDTTVSSQTNAAGRVEVTIISKDSSETCITDSI